jgi:preprotein translocase subunit SecF
MIQLFSNPTYDFIGKRRWTYLVSGVLVTACLLSLTIQGMRYDVDFTGGTLVQVRFERAPRIEQLRTALTTIGGRDALIQQYGDPREYIVRLPLTIAGSERAEATRRRVEGAFRGEPSLGAFELRRVDFVGPQVGRDLQWQAAYAVLFGLGGILLYVAIRFDLKGAVAAVLAVFHDVIVCLGALSLTQREFSLPVLAGVLTIIGYQVNDTIVAYDRLRENRTRSAPRGKAFATQMNDAVNQTLSRTVLTALTVVLTATVLFFFGGPSLEDFAFIVLIGSATGTYSTVYVAAALVVDWTERIEPWWRRRDGSRDAPVPRARRAKS